MFMYDARVSSSSPGGATGGEVCRMSLCTVVVRSRGLRGDVDEDGKPRECRGDRKILRDYCENV